MSKFSEGGGAILSSNMLLALGALAAKDMTIVSDENIDISQEQGFRVLKSLVWISVQGLTSPEGPVLLGAAGPGINAAELEEAIEAKPTAPWDVTASEEAMRVYWPLGLVAAGSNDRPLNDGVAIEFKPRWSFPEGSAMNWFAYNLDTAALQTGGIVHFFAKHFGVWLKD